MRTIVLVWVCLFISATVLAQDWDFSGTARVQGLYSNQELPWWMYTNSSNTKNANTNGLGYAFAKAQTEYDNGVRLEAGVGLMYRDGFTDRLQRSELYLRFTNRWLRATLGSANPEIAFDGLSSTNGNVLWSGNNRAIPGLLLESPRAIPLWSIFSFQYALGHYLLNDERFVTDTQVHYKQVAITAQFNTRSKLTGSLHHYAQWGGTHPELGALPSGFGDFVKVVFAQSAGDNAEFNEQLNALGNHLGAINALYEYEGKTAVFKAYHQHLFEDASGLGFVNFPDGVWGLSYAPKASWIKRLLYEYVTTVDQSQGAGRSAGDNYFSNRGYRSGWTYEGTTIGLPFIRLNPETGLGISNNLIKAHHLGGLFGWKSFELSAKLSFVEDAGSPSNQLETPIDYIYSYLGLVYHSDYGDLRLDLGADTNSLASDAFGIGLGYQYQF